ncbi:Hypothetical predicted protein [Podarcis lilfordi]|uniref:Uncharacterized protein n=1 Tax=Podarcis lilfordi TaxID=74358 RepID=A0AA35PIN4_9SAUR|nr:Hypothetical predicted protein [Podarcis lilfordi]
MKRKPIFVGVPKTVAVYRPRFPLKAAGRGFPCIGKADLLGSTPKTWDILCPPDIHLRETEICFSLVVAAHWSKTNINILHTWRQSCCCGGRCNMDLPLSWHCWSRAQLRREEKIVVAAGHPTTLFFPAAPSKTLMDCGCHVRCSSFCRPPWNSLRTVLGEGMRCPLTSQHSRFCSPPTFYFLEQIHNAAGEENDEDDGDLFQKNSYYPERLAFFFHA